MRTPGVRQDHRTGQFVPTVDGKDQSPTSFDEARALDIANQIARMKMLRCPECGEPVWDGPKGHKLAKCWNSEGHKIGGTLAFDTMDGGEI